MANILHLDENDVACRAFKGILTRAGHRCITVPSAPEAWDTLRKLGKFDLAVIELKLKGENGLNFLGRLREDPFLQHLPVVIYTSVADQAVVKKALTLHIQNYLIKPFSDAHIYAEISKATTSPWRHQLFEEEKAFCAQMGFSQHTLNEMRERLMQDMDILSGLLPLATAEAKQKEIAEKLDTLNSDAEATGCWGVTELLAKLKNKIEIQRWDELPSFIHDLDYGKLLLHCQVHPDFVPDGFLSDHEKKEHEETKERLRWQNVNVTLSGPVMQKSTVLTHIDALQTCPVIDSVAASFAMYADGQAANLTRVADLVTRDPGLSYQVLVAVNKIEREDMSIVDDPRTAISLLGELRLNSLSKTIPTIDEKFMQVPPMSWPQYWMYVMGVARIAQYTCHALEFKDIEPYAYTAGMIHDIGKLLLIKLYPYAFQPILNYAKVNNLPLHFAEECYIQANTREMAYHFSTLGGLPPVYANVIRWVETPEEATADADLVAVVALARMLCLHNHIGQTGDAPKENCPPIQSTPAWQILQPRIFPSFNLPQFESQVHAFSRGLKQELLGRIK